jgi:hypothetical protein
MQSRVVLMFLTFLRPHLPTILRPLLRLLSLLQFRDRELL